MTSYSLKLCLVGSLCMALQGQTSRKWKADVERTTVESEQWSFSKARNPQHVHRVVTIPNEVAAEVLEDLNGKGAAVVQYVPDGAIIVSGERDAIGGEAVIPEAKWSPALGTVARDNPVAAEEAANRTVLVEFFPDVDMNEARGIVNDEGLLIREHPDLAPNHLMVEGTTDQLERLTWWDEVAYVFPAADDLIHGEPAHACAGALTTMGSVGQYVAKVGEGWDGPGLGSVTLKYLINNMSSKVNAAAGQTAILNAFAEWSKYVQVTFQSGGRATDPRTINIFFASGAHGDSYAFDGRGGVLAHTFYPAPPNSEPIAGDLHFDADENWAIGADTDLFSVALHELGHALGLGHADAPSAVMYPYYRKWSSLQADDINTIQTMYAVKSQSTPAPTPTPTTPTTPSTPTPAKPSVAPAPKPADTVPPTLTISNPATVTTTLTSLAITLKGTAKDNVGVTKVTWTNSAGGSGTAAGTTDWTIANLSLMKGTNNITIRAYDAANNNSWRTIVVVRK